MSQRNKLLSFLLCVTCLFVIYHVLNTKSFYDDQRSLREAGELIARFEMAEKDAEQYFAKARSGTVSKNDRALCRQAHEHMNGYREMILNKVPKRLFTKRRFSEASLISLCYSPVIGLPENHPDILRSMQND